MTFIDPNHIQTVAEGGLGHPGASTAAAMAWFQNRLFLGTAAQEPEPGSDPARIHCYDPSSDRWTQVFESPRQAPEGPMGFRAAALSAAFGGDPASGEPARDVGIASMIVFQGKSDPHPCLYCGTTSVWGAQILRSEDGRTFAPVSAAGIDNDRAVSIQALAALDGVLYAAPTGQIANERIDRITAPEALVYASDDPASGNWRRANAPGFGDPVNTTVTALAAAHDHIYAGTASPRRGFQIWRTQGAKGPDGLPMWERVLTDGAYRFNHNHFAATLTPFKGDLYIGSGIPGLGYDEENSVGPAAAELIRLAKDGSWDLLVGQMRFTPDGLKVPFAAMGPGFSSGYNSVVSAMATLDGTLLLGLRNWEPHAWVLAGQTDQMQGGFELWTSQDGEVWDVALSQGHGKTTSVAIEALCPTPEGLFIGTESCNRLQAAMAAGRTSATVPDGFDVLRAPTRA